MFYGKRNFDLFWTWRNLYGFGIDSFDQFNAQPASPKS
jgi:hypothetical protein